MKKILLLVFIFLLSLNFSFLQENSELENKGLDLIYGDFDRNQTFSDVKEEKSFMSFLFSFNSQNNASNKKEVLFKLKNNSDKNLVDTKLNNLGIKIEYFGKASQVYVVKVSKKEVEEKLSKIDEIKHFYVNNEYNVSLNSLRTNEREKLYNDFGITGKDQTIVVLDTPFQVDHVFIKNKIIDEYCFSAQDSILNHPLFGKIGERKSLCDNGLQEDSGTNSSNIRRCLAESSNNYNLCSHGTHVAGIAAGEDITTSSNISVSGIAKDANLITMNIFYLDSYDTIQCGQGSTTCVLSSDVLILKGFEKTLELVNTRPELNISVLSMSVGSTSVSNSNCNTGTVFEGVVENLSKKNVQVLIASGNGHSTSGISSPACTKGVISIGSISESGVVSSFSNNGDILTAYGYGENIFSSFPSSDLQGFSSFSGTSMATPYAAGSLVLIKEYLKNYNTSQLLEEIQKYSQNATRNGITRPILNAYEIIIKNINSVEISNIKINEKNEDNQIIVASTYPKINLTANVSSKINLDKVIFEVTYPNLTAINHTSVKDSDTSNYYFELDLKEDYGNYSFVIHANNTDSISKKSETLSFEVVNLEIENFNIKVEFFNDSLLDKNVLFENDLSSKTINVENFTRYIYFNISTKTSSDIEVNLDVFSDGSKINTIRDVKNNEVEIKYYFRDLPRENYIFNFSIKNKDSLEINKILNINYSYLDSEIPRAFFEIRDFEVNIKHLDNESRVFDYGNSSESKEIDILKRVENIEFDFDIKSSSTHNSTLEILFENRSIRNEINFNDNIFYEPEKLNLSRGNYTFNFTFKNDENLTLNRLVDVNYNYIDVVTNIINNSVYNVSRLQKDFSFDLTNGNLIKRITYVIDNISFEEKDFNNDFNKKKVNLNITFLDFNNQKVNFKILDSKNNNLTLFYNVTLNLIFFGDENDRDGDGISDTNDKIFGDISSIVSDFNLSFEIGNDKNLTKIFSDKKIISIKNGNKKLLDFNFNFSKDNLDLTKIKVKENKNGVLIKGLEGISKNLTYTLKNLSRDICIKNNITVSFSQISNDCSDDDEILIETIENKTLDFDIEIQKINNQTILVSNLKNSALLEVEPLREVVDLVEDSPSSEDSGSSSGGGRGGGGSSSGGGGSSDSGSSRDNINKISPIIEDKSFEKYFFDIEEDKFSKFVREDDVIQFNLLKNNKIKIIRIAKDFIRINLNEENFELNLNELTRFDLEMDNIFDFMIEVKEISNNKVKLEIYKIKPKPKPKILDKKEEINKILSKENQDEEYEKDNFFKMFFSKLWNFLKYLIV